MPRPSGRCATRSTRSTRRCWCCSTGGHRSPSAWATSSARSTRTRRCSGPSARPRWCGGCRRSTTGPLPDESLGPIFREVMSACRALERAASIAYLGPEGTYSEQAVILQFGRSVTRRACASIDEIFREVEAKASDFGVIPIENSTEGTVNRSLDMLLELAAAHLRRSRARDPPSPAHERRRDDDGVAVARLRASAGARAMRGLARSPLTPRSSACRSRATGSPRRWPPTTRPSRRSPATSRSSVTGSSPVADHIQDLARNTTRFG